VVSTAAPLARRAWPGAPDHLLVAGVFGLTLLMLFSGRFESDARETDLPAVVLAALTALPLAWRRSRPLAVLLVTTLASVALYWSDYSLGPPLGSLVALFNVASHRTEIDPVRAAVLLVALTAAVLSTHLGSGANVVELLLGAAVWGGAWLAGDRARLRRERVAELEDRARRAEREAERERRLATAEERARIARDLHDSAGHAINVILVQAGAARLLHERDPARSRKSLETIEEVARETIGEIDRLVRALRDEGDVHEGGVEPPPGLAALEALAARHRSAGLPVAITVEGSPTVVPPDVSRAAYRILQEALTNAALHGDGAASVHVGIGGDALDLAVENPVGADGASRDGGGLGLVGMRERASLLGGSLTAERENGGFRVRARIPYRGVPR
jgi:signal transduction histidine kinase